MGLGLAVVAVLPSVAGTALWPRSPSAAALPGEYPGPTHCVAVLHKPVLPHAKSALPTSKENEVNEYRDPRYQLLKVVQVDEQLITHTNCNLECTDKSVYLRCSKLQSLQLI